MVCARALGSPTSTENSAPRARVRGRRRSRMAGFRGSLSTERAWRKSASFTCVPCCMRVSLTARLSECTPCLPKWQRHLESGRDGPRALKKEKAEPAPGKFFSESDFDVSLAPEPVHPMLARLVHLVQVDALRELVLRVVERRELRFIPPNELQDDEVVALAHGFRHSPIFERQRHRVEHGR